MRLDPDDAMAFLSFLAVLGVVTYSIYLRHLRAVLRHTERMTALEKGVALPDLEDPSTSAPWSPRVYLLRGMMWLFSGVAATVLLFFLGVASQREMPMTEKLLEAQRMRGLGATEWQVQAYLRSQVLRGVEPRATASLGLVPIGVGLAYLLSYRKERKAGPEA